MQEKCNLWLLEKLSIKVTELGSLKFPFPSTSQARLSAKRLTDTTGGRNMTGICGCFFSSSASPCSSGISPRHSLAGSGVLLASPRQPGRRRRKRLPAAAGTPGAASPAGPQAPSARDAEPSPALPRCEGVLGFLQGLRGADCKCSGLLGDFLPGFSATAGAVLF